MKHETRLEIEKEIGKRLIASAIAKGYMVGVNDGEETVIRHSVDQAALEEALRSTDEDYLIIYEGGEKGKRIGSIYLVYGNTGYDTICDYTANEQIEAVVKEVETYAERMEVRFG